MPALSPGDTTSWRTHPQNYRGALYLLKPIVVYAARTSYVADPIYPVSGIVTTGATTGAYTDVKEGMLVLVGTSAGADDLGRVWIQSDPVNATLPIPPCYQGISDGTVSLTNALYVTVLKLYLPRPKTPKIDLVSPYTMYKDGSLTVSTRTTTPPPVANAGAWMAGQVDTGTLLLTVSFSASGALATASGATIASVLWNVDGGTITVGTTTTTNITATFPAGYYYVKLTVTDSNGITHTRKTLVMAGNETTYKPIYNFKRTGCRHTGAGQTTTFVVKETIDMDDYPDGTAVILVKDELPALTSYAPTGRQTVRFCGWLDKEPTRIQATASGAIREVTLAVMDAAGKLARMREFPQIVRAVTSPALWTEATHVNVDQYTHYLLQWHSNILDLVDFQWTTYGYSQYPLIALDSDGADLFEQVDSIARTIGYFFNCDPWGRLALIPDEMQLPTVTEVGTVSGLAGLRSRSTTTTVALNETDWTQPTYTHKRPPAVYWEIGEAIVANATTPLPAFVIGPGAIPGYGESSKTVTRQVVVNSTELQYRIGKLLGIDNADDSLFDVTLAHGVAAEMFAPGINQWVTLEITSAVAAQRGETIAASTRFLVRELEIIDNDNALDQQVRLRIERETFGGPVQVEVRPDNEANLPVYDNPFDAFPEPDPFDGGIGAYQLFRGTKTIARFCVDGTLQLTSDFDVPSAQGGPTWTEVDLTADIPETVSAAVGDAFSPLYLQTGTTVNAWIASISKIYKVADIFGVHTVTAQRTCTLTGISFPQTRDIEAGWQTPGWVICVTYGYTSGTYVAWTTDGTNWSESQLVTEYLHALTNERTGIYVSSKTPGVALTSAHSAAGVGSIYRSTTYGAIWTRQTSPATYTPVDELAVVLHSPYADNADESIVYFGGSDSGAGGAFLKRKNADGTISDITPIVSGVRFQPQFGRNAIHSCPVNRQVVAFVGYGATSGEVAIFVSSDAGDNWTTVVDPTLTPDYLFVAIAGDSPDVLYFWGDKVGYSQDRGVTIDDRTGTSGGSSTVLIMGG